MKLNLKEGSKDISASLFIMPNPRRVIESKIKNKQCFEGFALSVSYFEHYGAKKIARCCYCFDISKNVFYDLFGISLEDMGVTKITQLLRFMKIIDQITYSNMKKVVKVRHRFIHPQKEGIERWFPTSTKEYKKLLNDAINCIEVMQKVRFKKEKK